MLYSSKQKSHLLILLFSAIYFIVGLIGILHHEVWLDEAHHFLIAKESTSIADLFEKIKYEGHPQLWSILLFVITRFTDNIFYMQLLNCVVMTAICFLFLKHSRFATMLNIVILCGYFFIYEYLVISRSYSLFLFALLLLFINLSGNQKPWKLYASLLLLSFTHVFGIIISVVACSLFLFKQLPLPRASRPAVFIIMLASLLIFASTIVPSDHFLNHYNTDVLLSYKRVSKTAGMFAKGLLTLPDLSESIKWNSNFFTNKLQLAGVICGFAAFIAILYFLRKNRPIMLFYFLSCLGIVAVIHVSPIVVSVRYCGILFILFLFIFAFLYTIISDKKLHYFIISLCVLQMISGIIIYFSDLNKQFSNGKKVASYIRENNLINKPLIVSNFSAAPPIAVYLNKPIYYAETHESGSYCKWNTWPFILENNQLATEIEKQLPEGDTLILVLNQHYFHQYLHDRIGFANDQVRYKLAKSFSEAMVDNENYFLFYVFSK